MGETIGCVGGGEAGREESYPSRGQSLAVRVWAHGQGTVEPYTSIWSTVSALEGGRETERHSVLFFLNGNENIHILIKLTLK